MRTFRIGLMMTCSSVLLSACAPDAWKPANKFDAFLNEVQNACYYDPVGTNTVGNLLNANASDDASYFIDETSRLYYGKITPQNWTLAITGQMDANATDRGVKCVLNEYAKEKKSWEK